MKNNNKFIIIGMILLLLVYCITPAAVSTAAIATAVSIGAIDYENLTMQIFYNNNSVVYYSTDSNTWTEVEGSYNSSSGSYSIDISWVPVSSDVTFYFKGDTVKTVKSVTIPAQNTDFSVDYDKVEGEFTFNETGDTDYFEWRKTSDYNWVTVSLDEASSSYKAFLSTMEKLRVKGASIIIRLPQDTGTGISDVGSRPSKEATVAIVARGTAPTVKINSSKLTINTTSALEYYDPSSDLWIECDGAMYLGDIAPTTLYENGGKTVTLKIRKAATSSAPYSKTSIITIPGQAAAPTIGDSSKDITYYYLNSKLVLQFNNASTTNIYEYTVVKAGYDLDITTSSWKSVSSSSTITLSASSAPVNCMIYVRKKGTDENSSTNTRLVLSSAVNSFTVTY